MPSQARAALVVALSGGYDDDGNGVLYITVDNIFSCHLDTYETVATTGTCVFDVGVEQAAGLGSNCVTTEVCVKHVVEHAHLN